MKSSKPLGGKTYGSIAHLPGSRLGVGDKRLNEGQTRILTEKVRDKHDKIIIREKVDGTCVAVAKIHGEIVPLVRSGYTAISSPHEQHALFHDWVLSYRERFDSLLQPGERICGEWLAMAHGINYKLPHEPFVVFDIIRDGKRVLNEEFVDRTSRFIRASLIHIGGALSIDKLKPFLENSSHGAIEGAEGAVYRVERKGVVDFLGKWVQPWHECGKYFSDNPDELIWNWRPEQTV